MPLCADCRNSSYVVSGDCYSDIAYCKISAGICLILGNLRHISAIAVRNHCCLAERKLVSANAVTIAAALLAAYIPEVYAVFVKIERCG